MVIFGSAISMIYKNFLINYVTVFWFLGLSIILIFLLDVPKTVSFSAWIAITILTNSLNLIFYNISILVEDRAKKFKIIYRIMGLKRNQYLAGTIVSSMILSTLLQLCLHVIAFLYRWKKSLPLEPFANEKGLLILGLAYDFQQTLVAYSMSFMFRKVETAQKIGNIISFGVLYITFMLCFLEKYEIVRQFSPFEEFIQFTIEIINKMNK